jgi:hypothetical protein
MNRITIQGSRELRSIPGVRNFGAHIGQALIMDEVVGIYFGENWISVDPNVDYDATLAKIQEVVDGYPGLYRDVQTYLKERIREVLTGAGEAIVVRIFGPELDVLRSTADEVRDAMAKIEGVKDLHVELRPGPSCRFSKNWCLRSRQGTCPHRPSEIGRGDGLPAARGRNPRATRLPCRESVPGEHEFPDVAGKAEQSARSLG